MSRGSPTSFALTLVRSASHQPESVQQPLRRCLTSDAASEEPASAYTGGTPDPSDMTQPSLESVGSTSSDCEQVRALQFLDCLSPLRLHPLPVRLASAFRLPPAPICSRRPRFSPASP